MILIVFGLPATGKTYLSKRAAEELYALHLDTDIIRKKLNLQDRYDAHSKQLVYDQMMTEMVHYTKNNQHVILEGTFQKEEHRRQFLLKARELNQEILFVELRAKEETIKERMKSNRKHSQAGFNVYKNIKKTFEYPQEPRLILWTDESDVTKLVQQLKTYLHGQRTDS